MRIQGLNPQQQAPLKPQQSAATSFMDTMKDYLGETNQLQNSADRASEQLMHGEIDIHNAMIVAEKANLALQLTMSIRNKVVDAYQEIMRMQV